MNKALTKTDIAAIEAYEAKQEAELENRRKAARSLEQIYIETFDGIIEGTAPRMHIMEVLAHLAAFLHDDDAEFRTDNSDPNNCQFHQKGLLSNLCQQADWMLEREERRMYYLRDQASKARYQHTGGEIDGLELHEAETAYGRSKIVNIPILTDLKTALKTAFLAQFAEEWTRPVKQDRTATTAALDDRFAHSTRRSRL